jgi:hypothetical protein
MEKNPDYLQGFIKMWPTMIDTSWIQSEVMTMKEYCASLMVHAPAHDQYRLMAEAVKKGEEELLEWPAPLISYLGCRTWLWSAG